MLAASCSLFLAALTLGTSAPMQNASAAGNENSPLFRNLAGHPGKTVRSRFRTSLKSKMWLTHHSGPYWVPPDTLKHHPDWAPPNTSPWMCTTRHITLNVHRWTLWNITLTTFCSQQAPLLLFGPPAQQLFHDEQAYSWPSVHWHSYHGQVPSGLQPTSTPTNKQAALASSSATHLRWTSQDLTTT